MINLFSATPTQHDTASRIADRAVPMNNPDHVPCCTSPDGLTAIDRAAKDGQRRHLAVGGIRIPAAVLDGIALEAGENRGPGGAAV